jgi:hypothetical protein
LEADFDILPCGPVSNKFRDRNIFTFRDAAVFVQQLPYARNTNKLDITTVLTENCGTCSTKHALLKVLAEENNFAGLKLVMGLFKMNGRNTSSVQDTLQQHNLDYIPEAHCYLKYDNTILDYTRPSFKPDNYINDLLQETEITAGQITDFKIAYHKNFLAEWLDKNRTIEKTPEEIWKIREQCIRDLQNKNK